MLVAPDDLLPLEVDGEHLVLVGAVIRAAAGDGRGRAGVGARRNREDFLAVADANRAQDLVAAGDVGDAIDDRWRAMNVALRLHFPEQLAVLGPERIEARVVRPDQHAVADDDRRGFDLALRLERPDGLAAGRVDRVHDAAEVADVDDAAGDCRRRLADADVGSRVLPARLSVCQADRVQHARLGADIDYAVGDCGRGFHRFAGFEGPQHAQLVGQRRRRRPEEGRAAAELGPAIRGRRQRSAPVRRARRQPGDQSQRGQEGRMSMTAVLRQQNLLCPLGRLPHELRLSAADAAASCSGCRRYLPSAIANSWLRLTRKIAPLAGTAVEYTELPMLFSAIIFIVLSAAMTATSPSSSPR